MPDGKGGCSIDIELFIFILIIWSLIMFVLGPKILHTKSCSAPNEQIMERLDEITQQNEYIMNVLNDK